MPSFDIIRQTKCSKSFRAQSIMSQFSMTEDNTKEHFQGIIPIEDIDWQIGAIVGASGTGKSTIIKDLFPEHCFESPEYSGTSIVDDFPQEIETRELCKAFNSVGFSSPPSWLKPYSVLSTGEKMRVDLAHCLCSNKNLIVFDEFTSVVDRTVAKIGSCAMAKAIRRGAKQFIVASCHKDFLEWLEPDWVFDTDSFQFFFATTPDQRSRLTSIRATGMLGECLGSIII